MTNTKNWEAIYEAILLDVVSIVENGSNPADQIKEITNLLVSNDFINKSNLWG